MKIWLYFREKASHFCNKIFSCYRCCDINVEIIFSFVRSRFVLLTFFIPVFINEVNNEQATQAVEIALTYIKKNPNLGLSVQIVSVEGNRTESRTFLEASSYKNILLLLYIFSIDYIVSFAFKISLFEIHRVDNIKFTAAHCFRYHLNRGCIRNSQISDIRLGPTND